MKILSVKYGRVANLGNYETERLEVEVAVENEQDQHDARNAIIEAKKFVNAELGIEDELTEEQYKKMKKAVARFERKAGC